MSLNHGQHCPARRRPPIARAATLAGLLALSSMLGASASAEPEVATSVCEAQRLKARKALDPRVEIEIPAEFDKTFPSLEACESELLILFSIAPHGRKREKIDAERQDQQCQAQRKGG